MIKVAVHFCGGDSESLTNEAGLMVSDLEEKVYHQLTFQLD